MMLYSKEVIEMPLINVSKQEIQSLIINASAWLRNGTYSAFISSFLSGWY